MCARTVANLSFVCFGFLVPQLGDVYRVIDEAFAAAMRAQCSVVTMSPHEVLMILDALGFTFGAEPLLGGGNTLTLTTTSSQLVDVPMLR